MGATIETTLVLEALNRALGHHLIRADQLLIHTDLGGTAPRPSGSCWRTER